MEDVDSAHCVFRPRDRIRSVSEWRPERTFLHSFRALGHCPASQIPSNYESATERRFAVGLFIILQQFQWYLEPAEKDPLQQVDRDWTQFNDTLAFATARFAYYHLLPHRDIMIRPLSQATPDNEQKAVVSAYPVFSWLLTTLLRLSAKNAQPVLTGSARFLKRSTRDSLLAQDSWLAIDSPCPTWHFPWPPRPFYCLQVMAGPSRHLTTCRARFEQPSTK
jgi:hypothetical protein